MQYHAYAQPSPWISFVDSIDATVKAASGKVFRQSFTDFLGPPSEAWPWEADHIQAIRSAVEGIQPGGRLMLFMPPRHYKSQLVTVRYTAWRISQQPDMRCIVGCYNATLAQKFSRQIRRMVRDRVPLSRERAAADDWETEVGGGLRAVGVGSGVTGHGANMMVIDDPVKNREEANSEAYRERCYSWYTDDLYTRLEPGASVILIMTRWHEMDLAGRILQETPDDWDILRLPALAETQIERDAWAEEHNQPLGQPDPLDRQPGQPLDPIRFPLHVVEDQRRVLGNSFSALMQQTPKELEGGLFKKSDFIITDSLQGIQIQRWLCAWDKAGTEGAGDYTVGVLLGRSVQGIFYAVDVVRGQWDMAERERVIAETVDKWHGLHGVRHVWLEQEPGSGGKDSAKSTAMNLARYIVEYQPSTGSKTVRAEPAASANGNGLIQLVRGPWNRIFINELCTFPAGAHDDQVDAFSLAYNRLADYGIAARRTERGKRL